MNQITSDLRSKVISNLVKDVPGFMTKQNVQALATDSKRNFLSFEDATEAIQSIEISEANKKDIDHKEDSTSLKDLFPNVRLTAELDIIKETNRTKYDDFTKKMFELDGIAKEIDAEVGDDLNFLLDEIKQNAEPALVDEIKNMNVCICNVESKGKVS